MKLVAVALATTVATAVGLVATPRPASACGVPDVGMILADVAKAFETKTTPVHTPLIVVGGGSSTEGQIGSVAVGYGWGEKEDTWLFPGTTITRVLVGLRSNGDDTTAMSATVGWYTNTIASLGLDAGVEAQMSGTRGLGPTARLTVGLKGVAMRFTGGAMFGDETRFAGAAELVVEVMDLGGTL
jgi:hypothetical protein